MENHNIFNASQFRQIQESALKHSVFMSGLMTEYVDRMADELRTERDYKMDVEVITYTDLFGFNILSLVKAKEVSGDVIKLYVGKKDSSTDTKVYITVESKYQANNPRRPVPTLLSM